MRLLLLPAPLLLLACTTVPAEGLARVRTWGIQLHGDLGDTAPYDMLVLDPSMRPVAGKTCLAYVNVGEAEEYRPYWKTFWRAPEGGPGVPDYLLAADPDGWKGNYVVAYWDPRWQSLLWGGAGALVDEALAAGFDGVFLDWVLAYRAAAVADRGGDPERAMERLVCDLAAYARRKRPGAFVVLNNGALLAARSKEVRRAIDGVVQESLWFGGRAGASWGDADAGGALQAPPPELLAALAAIDRPVFTLDYAVREEHARGARAASLDRGFVPFVSRTPLDRLP
ncbi:MAG: endo alpha-1,4 polygalactosaminidase [Planctomycetota bacterium]